jgi:hypothetical protein
VYSLVSATALGFDLARHPLGGRVASVVSTCLGIGPRELPLLTARHLDDGVRAAAWIDLSQAETAGVPMPGAPRGVGGVTTAPGGVWEGSRPDRGRAIGDLDSLLRCLRQDVFDWTWERSGDVAVQSDAAARAVAVACDAAAAAYDGERLPADSFRRLYGPWVRATRGMALPPAYGACHDQVAALLARLGRMTAADLVRLDGAARRARGRGLHWAQCVHTASWAVHLSDRVRPAARAQLDAVQALRSSDPSPDRPGALWNLISGALQAAVVADVLDDPTAEALLEPVLGVLSITPR